MRRKPRENLLPSAHAVDAEFRVIGRALALSVTRRAGPYGLCMDESVVGTISSWTWSEGRILWDGQPLPDYETRHAHKIFTKERSRPCRPATIVD